MKKNIEISNFNLGEYLGCVYHYWKGSINKSVFVNEALRLLLKNEKPFYELDKSSISRLSSHTYDLPKSIKRIICFADDSITKDVTKLIKEAIICSIDVLAKAVYDTLLKASEKDSESTKHLIDLYNKGDCGSFLFQSFKHASSMPNTPTKQKAKTGRKPRGSFNSIFYLSEEEKVAERNRLVTKIMKSGDRLTEPDFNELIELMAYTSLNFSKNDRKTVAVRFLKQWKTEVTSTASAEFLDRMETAKMTFGESKADKFSNWEKPVAEAEASLAISRLPVAFRKAERQKSFAEVRRVLNSISHNQTIVSSDAFKTMLIENNFFLPDFSEHITHSLWGYCLDIACLSKQMSLATYFCDVLNEMYPTPYKNNTIAERVETLKKTAKNLKIS